MSRLAAIFAVVGLLASPAAAQDARTQARRLFEQGVAQMDANNPGGAIPYFQQSYQQFPRASTACNMALALERTGRGCESIDWYRQCAALDSAGQFRTHATRQAEALSQQCPVMTPAPNPTYQPGPGAQVVEAGTQRSNPFIRRRGYDHTMLGVGIPLFVAGAGAIVGGAFSADEAHYRISLVNAMPGTEDNPTLLPEGTPDADAYNQAQTYSNLAVALYVGGALLSAVGALLIVLDLSQPGLFGSASAPQTGPRLTFAPLPEGGGQGELSLRF